MIKGKRGQAHEQFGVSNFKRLFDQFHRGP